MVAHALGWAASRRPPLRIPLAAQLARHSPLPIRRHDGTQRSSGEMKHWATQHCDHAPGCSTATDATVGQAKEEKNEADSSMKGKFTVE